MGHVVVKAVYSKLEGKGYSDFFICDRPRGVDHNGKVKICEGLDICLYRPHFEIFTAKWELT